MKTGKLPENALKRSVLRQISKNGKEVQSGAGIGRDCAILAFPEEEGLTVAVQEAAVMLKERKKPGSGAWEFSAVREACETGGTEGAAAKSSVKADSFSEPFMTMGELMQKCANNLAAGGSWPVAFMVTLLMPENTEEGDIRALMAEAAEKAEEMSKETEIFSNEPVWERSLIIEGQAPEKKPSAKSGTSGEGGPSVKIIGGQTRITGGVAFPYGVVTGFGRLWRDMDKSITTATDNGRYDNSVSKKPDRENVWHGPGKALPGQDVVLSKWIGLQGTAVLAKRNREKLSERYPGWLAEKAAGFGRYLSVLPEAEIAARAGVQAMHDASEGGILGALWELAEGAGRGLTIDMRKLPLRQETVEICECCNVNPYELLSGGCLIMTAEDGPALAAALERAGIPGTVVGKVTDSNDRILLNGEEIRYMDRPQRDGVYHK